MQWKVVCLGSLTNIALPFFLRLSRISFGKLLIRRYTAHAFFVPKVFNRVPSQYRVEMLTAIWSGSILF